MARRSQCSDAGDNPLDPNYLPPHYREEYRLAVDALVEQNVDGYYKFLQFVDVVDFLSPSEIDYIQSSVQLPKSHAPDLRSHAPDSRYLDSGGDGSSDTYWPLHSDLDAPGLDLGWPQIHHFIGPTEVTTLVNPAAPDMPSIKEQARRLIKNAQMVIAVVMDMFTDVDIFADILNAAMRNVAVYLLLDETNVGHFINMVHNCRVQLQNIQFLRVRTVSGIRYHCRSGKSLKGQMLDRFILTDCRAVLSGNYSFMWSYEKLHRCMAHLFLGQLVTTFDEEFRILFAQSEPLIIENVDHVGLFPKHGLTPGDRGVIPDTRKYLNMPMEEERDHRKYLNMGLEEENADWRMAPVLKRHEGFQGSADIYNRYSAPQTRPEPHFEPGPKRIMDSLVHKRHSFAEGAAGGRYSLPYQQQQQALADVDQPGRAFYRGQHLHPRDETDYGQMDKFWNQDFQQEEPCEPGYSREMEEHEGYDPVMNYLSSTRHLDVDQSSDKLISGVDMPYNTTHPRRHTTGKPYTCQTSPTPSNTTEKRFMAERDRKDPMVKKGLRNWRISSYLSAYDDAGEPEGLPMATGQPSDPFDDMQHPTQQQTPPPPAIDLAPPKIPNVREFKVPAMPRASQMPSFTKTAHRDPYKRFPDDITQQTPPLSVVSEPKVVTPTPSESSSTTDGEKQEEPELREPITSALRRDDSFRRKYNAAAIQRSSRLRSSLIFSSLEQNVNQESTEQEDDKMKAETEAKLPFVSQVLAQRRSGTREPFEWRSYIKSTDNTKTEEDGSNPDGKQPETTEENDKQGQEVAKSEVAEAKEAVKSPELAPKVKKAVTKPSIMEQFNFEQPPPFPPSSSLNEQFVDMDDPDQRLLFFKDLAARRKAARAAEDAKLKQESAPKDTKEEKKENEPPQRNEEKKKPDAKTLGLSSKVDKPESSVTKVPPAKESCENAEAKLATKDDNEQNKAGKPDKDEKLANIKEASQKALDWSCEMGKYEPTPLQSCEPIQTKDVTDSEKIEAKHNRVSLSTHKVIPEKSSLQTTDATNSAEKGEEMAPAPSKDVLVKDLTLKTSRSVPDFAESTVSDLLSSLPSARISERSSSHETVSKPRLWSPSMHRMERLKPFGDKQKSISSSVGQIEEVSKAQETTGAKEEEISAGESKGTTASKMQFLPSISENTQPQLEGAVVKSTSTGTDVKKDGNETRSLRSPTETSNKMSKLSSPEDTPSQTEISSVKPATGSSRVKEDGKDLKQLQSVMSEQPKMGGKLVNTSAIIEKDKKPEVGSVTQASTGQDKLASFEPVSAAAQTPQIQDSLIKSNIAEVKDSKTPSFSQTTTAVEMTKAGLKQPIMEKCTDLQEKSKEKHEGTAEKVESIVKQNESASIIAVKPSVETKPGSVGSANSLEMMGGDSVSPSQSKDLKKVDQEEIEATIDDARQKPPPEDSPPLESHSNTSSPASFATALEFISSEDSDMFSPARNDPQHLFKLGKSESSMSDMSDFETPSSDLSMSPMPFAVCTDDMLEDNVSVAETVIETASRRKSETAEQQSPRERRETPLLEDLSAENLVTTRSEAIMQLPMPIKASGSTLNALGNVTRISETGEDRDAAKNAQSETSSASSQEVKVDENLVGMTTEGSAKAKSDVKENSEATKESISTSNQSVVQLDKEKVSPTAAGESKDPKQQEMTMKKGSVEAGKGPAAGQEEVQSLTNQSKPCLIAEVEKEEISEVSDASNLQTKARTVSSQFLSEPQASAKSQTSTDTPQVMEQEETRTENTKDALEEASETKGQTLDDSRPEIQQTDGKMVDQTADIREKSQSAAKNMTESAQETKEQNVETSEPPSLEQTTEINPKEVPAAAESVGGEKDAKAEPEILQASSSAGQDKLSPASPAKEDHETVIIVRENSEKDENELSRMSKPKVGGYSMEPTISPATSEDSKVLESTVMKEASDNSQSKVSEPAKATETAPPGGQPKPQQQKAPPSRYMSSTANIISCSNLRDDTKILLEQISAQSQNRSETTATDDEKEDHAEKQAKHRKEKQLRDSNKSSQERDKVLERIQTMRKDRKVYSRFEL